MSVQVPKKYGNMKIYRVDLVFVIPNESNPAPELPGQFMLIRKRSNGKVETLVPIGNVKP